MIWDFTSAGFKDGVREFFLSLFKTTLAAAVAFLTLHLGEIHLSPDTANFEIYSGILIFLRAVFSGFSKWVNTIDTPKVLAGPPDEIAA